MLVQRWFLPTYRYSSLNPVNWQNFKRALIFIEQIYPISAGKFCVRTMTR